MRGRRLEWWWAVLVLAGSACAHRGESQGVPVAEALPPPAAKPPVAKPPAPRPAPKAVPTAPAAAPAQHVQARSGGPTAPPRAPALTSWSAEGCLTAKNEQAAQAFAKQRRTAAGPAVALETRPGDVVVVHRLAHACCLAAQVTSRVEGDRYVVTERLTGKACRCVCDSTIRTVLRTTPGKRALALDLYTAGGNRRVFEGTLAPR